MRYRPLTEPIARVYVEGNIRIGGGRVQKYLVSMGQHVEGIYWPGLCTRAGCPQDAAGLSIDADRILHAVCASHGPDFDLDEAAEAAGCSMRWMSEAYTRWARLKIAQDAASNTRTRCPCRFLSVIERDAGLHLYFHQLWTMGEMRNGLWAARCRSCGVAWEYYRDALIGRKLS